VYGRVTIGFTGALNHHHFDRDAEPECEPSGKVGDAACERLVAAFTDQGGVRYVDCYPHRAGGRQVAQSSGVGTLH
jgi:hypothetical protein